MLVIGATFVLAGIAVLWIEPKWIPGVVRRGLPHVGIVILGWYALADNLVIAHLDWRITAAADSSLRIVAPDVAQATPRAIATFMPPSFIGTSRTLNLVLQLMLMVAISATILVFTNPRWLAASRVTLEKLGYTMIILFGAWLTGINSRAIAAVQTRLRVDPDAPVSTIAEVVASIPREYRTAAFTCLIILAAALYIEGLRYVRERFSPVGDAV